MPVLFVISSRCFIHLSENPHQIVKFIVFQLLENWSILHKFFNAVQSFVEFNVLLIFLKVRLGKYSENLRMSCLQVRLVMQFLHSGDFSVQNRFQVLTRNREYHINVFEFQLSLRHVDLVLSLSCLVLELLNLLLGLKVSNHLA